MSELQALVSNWLSTLVAAVPVGYSFGAGILAAVNPCGFAMLPAYLSLYLGAEEAGFAEGSASRLLRALGVGTIVSLGFVLMFGVAGVVVSAVGNALLGAMPPLGVLIGLALALLGLWMLAGGAVYVPIFQRLAARLGTPKAGTPKGFFLFGLAYGLASLSCTLPVFMVVVGSGVAAGGFPAAAMRFLAYGMGMASVIVALTLAVAFLKWGLVARFRKLLPRVQVASAILLIVAGGYLILYWLPILTRAA